MPELVLGPMLRHVGTDSANVWVEADAPCTVEVRAGAARGRAATFAVAGHHYAVVIVEGLRPGTTVGYQVRLDDEQVWPRPGDPLPAPEIRTWVPGTDRVRIVLGSCRTAAPHTGPWTLPPGGHPLGRGIDALHAYARRLASDRDARPDALLMLGDQVYADDASPLTRRFIRSRRDPSVPPGEEVADLEEYTRLYREAWEEPWIRWLLSTVPTGMVFDDHDITDDWNISASWQRDVRAKAWWEDRIAGGLAAYWLYQHLGNLRPQELVDDELYRQVRGSHDAADLLHRFALEADRHPETFRWSFDRDLGPVRLVVVDSRAGRVLGDGRRDMLDASEWDWLAERIAAPTTHLLVASSLPVLLAPGIHAFEAWNEAVCDGAWGRAAARAGERVRRGLDLEHWAAFQGSFERLWELLRATGSRPDAPASIVLASGDVHHGYVATAAFRRSDRVRSRVHQVVASPMRNSIEPELRAAYRFALTAPGEAVGRLLARAAGVAPPSLRWRLTAGPWFDNHLAELEANGAAMRLTVHAVTRAAADQPQLEPVLTTRLA